jgi:hypothetical protein
MSAPKPKSDHSADSLYERDFFLWTVEQSEALRKAAREGSNLPLDWQNLAEEIESLGRSDKRGVESRIAQIIVHLWKLACSPATEPRQLWKYETDLQRLELDRLLEESPSLRARVAEFVSSEMKRAEKQARISLSQHGEFDKAEKDFVAFKMRGISADEVLTEGLFPSGPTGEFRREVS